VTALIRPESRFGRKWARLITVAAPVLRSGAGDGDLYTAWPIEEMRDCRVAGPLVYTALGHGGVVMWVGSTGQQLRDRTRAHLRDPAKARSFTHLVAIPLERATPQATVGALERRGKMLLQPMMGNRWPKLNALTVPTR
jgi:hypothetical protein